MQNRIPEPEKVSPYQLDQNMKIENHGADERIWYSPQRGPFQVSGFGWFHTERIYRRLPSVPDVYIRPEVDALANCTSGGQIRFRTNSRSVSVRVRLTAGSGMYHMPPTGECGVDAYIGGPGHWLHAGTARFQAGQVEYESSIFDSGTSEARSFLLNMPLYQGVEEIWIGLEPGAEVWAPESYDSSKKVIVYGTSITQGGCASRPGMSYTNILSRRFHLEFINLGFSGNGKGESELAILAAQIPEPACLVIDYEGNAGSTESYRQTLPLYIETYRKVHPEVPIILISRIRHGAESFKPEILEGRLARKKFQMDLIRQLTEAGDHNLTFVDGSDWLGDDPGETTVDGVHPTDLGFKLMADRLEPVLRQVIGDSASAAGR
ncbi:SGNH/GDSL hydrolase family protein [Paenibacillus sp. FSL K6-1330]|uniref:SGNH/GDSL hydrolase family protein n=2 Tax=unclassified Paenibacillus TaxID=185978 RepID=UPI0030DB28FC